MRKDPEIVPTFIIKNSSYCTVYAFKRRSNENERSQKSRVTSLQLPESPAS
jgi:hypothetical protein